MNEHTQATEDNKTSDEQRWKEQGWNEAVESLLEFEHINATVARWFKEDNPYRADRLEGDDAESRK